MVALLKHMNILNIRIELCDSCVEVKAKSLGSSLSPASFFKHITYR